MKMFCVLVLNLCVIFYARAGGDVPWPITSQEAVRVSDLTGTWVSVNLKDPGYLYFFSFSTNKDLDSSCPYRLTVQEMNPFEQLVISSGFSTVCQVKQSSITFKLYDSVGTLRHRLDIVGVRKDENEGGLGQQYLGVMIYDVSNRPLLVAADTFFKYSNLPEPQWPESNSAE